MGHRHIFGAPQIFDNDHDQNWNMHEEQSFGHNIASGNVGENGSFCYPAENISTGVQFTSHWNSDPRSNTYIPMARNDQVQPCQPDASGLAQDPFMPRSNVAAFGSVPENYFPHSSSLNYNRQAPYAVEGSGFTDITMDRGRANQKRKSPGAISERGSSSRYDCGETSSDVPPSSEYRQDMTSMDAHQFPWDNLATSNPGYRSNCFSLGSEGSSRNVRSRSGIDLENHPFRSHLSDNPPLNSFRTSYPVEHSSSLDIPVPSSNALTADWSHANISPANGRILLPDPRGLVHESNHFLGASDASNAPPDPRGYDFMASRNSVVPQIYHGSSSHSQRCPRNSYSHRSTPAYRPSNGMRLGNANPSDDGSRSLGDNYSRHQRSMSATGWRNGDRNRRSRTTNERYRPFPDEAGVHDRMGYEGFMVVDRSALHAQRSMFDQHRDMRLDIDNMGYEELLALGERIGTVSTGLSEDSISNCLKESMQCSLIQMENEESCAICLEAYREAEKVGTLKTCSHHYHVNCIKKWLSMKNLCPICKGSALADDMKDKEN